MKLFKTFAPALTAASVAALFAACGDSASSDDSKNDKTPEYETAEDMVHCTKSHYGEFAYVKDEDAYYECTADGWNLSDSTAVEEAKSSSSSDGDSEDPEKVKSSSSVSAADTASVDVEKVDSAKVYGFAQKGPFVSGSVVTVYGLDSSLEATSEKFTGKVAGDSGYFKIEGITLESQFALVEANGFYKNAVTGKNTSGSKTKLHAIVDLSKNDVNVNVNILTELEYARVKTLVTKEKFNVPAAKVRATSELLALFGASVKDEISATELSLADDGAAGTALYAASIALQGDLSASKFNSRLSEIAEDFAEDGKWDDDEVRTEIADYLSEVDSLGGFDAILENVKSMKLSEKVPDYESVLYAYWTDNYDLGTCNEDKETSIVKNKNKTSSFYGAGYVCVNNRWHKTTALDTELGLCLAKREGEFAQDTTGKTTAYYVCQNGAWKSVSAVDYELKLCTEDRVGEVAKVSSGDNYICRGISWTKASAEDVEVGYGCVDSLQNKVVKSSAGNYFICKDGEWLSSDAIVAALGECTSEMVESGAKGTVKTDYYLCEKSGWKNVTKTEYEQGYCTTDRQNEYVAGYICDNLNWREATTAELATEKVCNSDNDSTFASGYACVNGEWRAETDGEKANGDKFCSASIANTVSKQYVCQANGEWREATVGEIATLKVCSASLNNGLVDVTNKYTCKNGAWTASTAGELATESVCSSSNRDKVSKGYVCALSGSTYDWRVASDGEVANGRICTSALADTVLNKFACVNNSGSYAWRTASSTEIIGKAVCRSAIEKTWRGDTLSTSTTVICEQSGSSYAWRFASAGDIANKKVCNSSAIRYVENGYVCENYSWRAANAAELATGLVCYGSRDSVIKASDGYTCLCNASKTTCAWRAATDAEIATGKFCTTKNDSTVKNGYSCKNGSWSVASTGEKLTGKVCRSKYYSKYVANSDTTQLAFCQSTGSWVKVTDGNTYTVNDSRDGKSYTSIVIKGQIWMTANMNYQETAVDSNRCYNGTASNCTTYGRLYSYNASGADQYHAISYYADRSNDSTKYIANSVQIQGVCPTGFHLPRTGEWLRLVRYYDPTYVGCYEERWLSGYSSSGCYGYYKFPSYSGSGKFPLKSKTLWSNYPGSNESGFNALPGGFYSKTSNTSMKLKSIAAFWAVSDATWYADDKAILLMQDNSASTMHMRSIRPSSQSDTYIDFDYDSADRIYASVRCLRDYVGYGYDN